MVSNIQLKALNEYKKHKFIAIPLIGKRPFFKNWTKLDHTSNDLTVFNNHNIGILTGKSSKITILDIDVQNNGINHWNNIKKLYPTIITPTVKTISGGYHLYFKYNSKLSSTSKLRLNNKYIGWDILNDGRQAVAPPSINYKWIQSLDTPLAKMPTWLEYYILLLKN